MSREIMNRIKYGADADDAFAELVANWQGRLLAFARRSVGDIDVAEDIVQETFLRVWRCRHSYDDRGRFDSWLYRIVRNVIVNRHRSRRCDPVYDSVRDSDEYSVTAAIEGETDDPLATLIHREQVAGVMSAIDRLSLTSDSVAEQMLTLLDSCDESLVDAAKLNGVKYKTLRSRRRIAIEKLTEIV